MADAREVWRSHEDRRVFRPSLGLDAATIDWLRAAYIEEV